jgi:hypothetical protein
MNVFAPFIIIIDNAQTIAYLYLSLDKFDQRKHSMSSGYKYCMTLEIGKHMIRIQNNVFKSNEQMKIIQYVLSYNYS